MSKMYKALAKAKEEREELSFVDHLSDVSDYSHKFGPFRSDVA